MKKHYKDITQQAIKLLIDVKEIMAQKRLKSKNKYSISEEEENFDKLALLIFDKKVRIIKESK